MSISVDLSGTSVFMTACFGAIADPVVKTLHEAGAVLFLTDIVGEAQAIERLQDYGVAGENTHYAMMDVRDSSQIEGVCAKAFELTAPDIVLGHAGGCGLHPFANVTEEHFRELFDFNFFGQVSLMKAVLPRWVENKTHGKVIFTSSYVARVPHKFIPAYASAKAALENLMKSLALEYAPHSIRVNCVSPGNVAAGASVKVYEEDDGYRAFVDRATPFGGRNTPQAIANAVLYLASSLGAEINGQVISVDNGITIPKID